MNEQDPGVLISAKCAAGATDPSRTESANDCSNPREKKWPVPVAAILCWLLPATVAKRTQCAQLTRVYLLHVLMLVAAALLILQFDAWGDSKPLMTVLAGVWKDLEKSPPGPCGFILLVFAGIEAFHLAVAMLFTPWGARDEPLRDSFRNALRQTLLHTAHFVVLIAFIGGLALGLHSLAARWKLPSLDIPPGLIAFPPGSVLLAWIAFSLVRAIGASRRIAAINRPPACTSCGYNLTLIPMEARCPECGSEVADSLALRALSPAPDASATCVKCDCRLGGLSGADLCPACYLPVAQSVGMGSQIGTPWERRHAISGMFRAWRQTAGSAIFAPEQLGRTIRLTAPTGHRSFLAMHLPLILLIAPIALILHILRFEQVESFSELIAFGLVSGTFGVVCLLAAFGVVNLAALLVGLPESLRAGRNMLPASIQMACYLAPYIVAWEILGAALVLWLTYEALLVEAYAEMIGVLPEFFGMAVFMAPNILIALFYLHLIARGTKAARYANT